MKNIWNKETRVNLCIVLFSAAVVLTGRIVHADNLHDIKSQGVIKFTNGTENITSDDVILDTSDFVVLYNICK